MDEEILTFIYLKYGSPTTAEFYKKIPLEVADEIYKEVVDVVPLNEHYLRSVLSLYFTHLNELHARILHKLIKYCTQHQLPADDIHLSEQQELLANTYTHSIKGVMSNPISLPD